MDIDSAFRNIPILPAHKAFIVIQTEPGVFYIDHVCPFGVASGTGVQGEMMDAVVDILEANNVKPNKKWVDDLITFRFPISQPSLDVFTYAHGIDDIFRITEPLGTPWKLGKCFPFGFQATYMGLWWDLSDRSVALPEAKRTKYLKKLEAFIATIARQRTSMKDAMSINGTLAHIAFVYPTGRSYLTNLCSFIASFPNSFSTRFAPHSLISDMNWWLDTLRIQGVKRHLTPREPMRDLGIWVDASTSWGIGIIVAGQWAAWKLVDGWKTDGRDIAWAEMTAIELAVRTIEQMGLSNTDILIRGDNTGVAGAYNRGRSRNFRVNESIRRTNIIATHLNIRFYVEYVNTLDNLADSISRGDLARQQHRLSHRIELPKELEQLLTRYEP